MAAFAVRHKGLVNQPSAKLVEKSGAKLLAILIIRCSIALDNDDIKCAQYRYLKPGQQSYIAGRGDTSGDKRTVSLPIIKSGN